MNSTLQVIPFSGTRHSRESGNPSLIVWIPDQVGNDVSTQFLEIHNDIRIKSNIQILDVIKIMPLKTEFTLLTFYKFVAIKNPEQEVKRHLIFCRDIGMKGRIYLGEEGISATVSCNKGQLQAYKAFLVSNAYFNDIEDIDIKSSSVKSHAFEKMIVKYRPEIVSLGIKVDPKQVKKVYQKISVDEFKNIVDSSDQNYEILDMRNSYEYKLGHFKNSLPSGTVNFKEVKALVKEYGKKFKNKKVVMYCTGGIRCEKLSVLLKNEGVDNFYSLDGGIVKYINTHNDGNWLGNLYTFDGLVSTPVGDEKTHTKIGTCIYTGASTDYIENCRYSPCNARIITTRKAYKQHLGFCSQECFDKGKKDLLIKPDFSLDKKDYKDIRSQIKLGKLKLEETREGISRYLDNKLGKHSFNHKESQKEEYVDSCMI
ncbi:MAG: rhodanese-like domain-containing protein [candidate division SR1 bacterium]|nr:rhodanese-like domain-containing protein [candidate division SR1 bacterium]